VKLGRSSNSNKQFRLYKAFNVVILLSYEFNIYTKKVEHIVNIYIQPKKGDPVTDCIYRLSKNRKLSVIGENHTKAEFLIDKRPNKRTLYNQTKNAKPEINSI